MICLCQEPEVSGYLAISNKHLCTFALKGDFGQFHSSGSVCSFKYQVKFWKPVVGS